MPRSARTILPNTPHHIVQRGHNRQTVFTSEAHYKYYLANLMELKIKFHCKIFAYCLMSNHIHLVLDPGDTPESLSMLMKHVAGRQTRYINKRERRTGSLWDGRFKSSIISTIDYFPACCRYIELNPLRAGIVSDPLDYKWSSYRGKTTAEKDPLLDNHPFYLSLGRHQRERSKMYAEYVFDTIPDSEIKLIRQALQRGQLTGGERFREEINKKMGILVSNKGPGRPKGK